MSAISFIIAYVTMFSDPAKSALIGWLVSMVSRQSGHFFFEPKGYDAVNRATHEHKEEIKVGYNLRRKVILHAVWALCPLVLWLDPTFFGLFTRACQRRRNSCATWARSGSSSASARCCSAPCSCSSSRTCRPAWCGLTKILTDPFNDVKIYCKAPLYLLRGELIDPMGEVEAEAHRA